MTDYDFAAWPDVLAELAQLIGPESALRLAHHCGGIEYVYVPREPTPDHAWAAVLSPVQWSKVVHAWGGQRISLPRGTHVRLAKREILALAEQGVPHRQIAMMVHTTQRHVRRVLQGLPIQEAADSRQMGLPFDTKKD